jgi:hypothetical protein
MVLQTGRYVVEALERQKMLSLYKAGKYYILVFAFYNQFVWC